MTIHSAAWLNEPVYEHARVVEPVQIAPPPPPAAPVQAPAPAKPARYPAALRALHWVVAVLVIGQLALALILGQLRSLAIGQLVLELHQSVGVLLLALVGVRFGMGPGLRERMPARAADLPDWQHGAAKLVHGLLLALLLLQPLLGIGLAWARGVPVGLFGLVDIAPPFEFSEAAGQRFVVGHIAAGVLMMLAVGVHVGAVFFNRLMRGVSVMPRMLPAPPQRNLHDRLPLIGRLGAAFLLVAAVGLIAGGYALHQYRHTAAAQSNLVQRDVRAAELATGAQLAWKELLALSERSGEEIDQRRADLFAQARDNLEHAASLASRPATAGALTLLGQRIDAAPAGGWTFNAMIVLDGTMQSTADALSADLFQLRTEQAERAARGHDMVVLSLLPLLLASLTAAIWLAHGMAGAMQRMRAMVRAVADGQAQDQLDVTGHGEFALLSREMLAMSAAVAQRSAAEAERFSQQQIEHQRVAAEQAQRLRDAEHARRTEEHERRLLELRHAREAEAVQHQQQAEREQARLRQQQELLQVEQRASQERAEHRRRLAEHFQLQVADILVQVRESVSALRGTAAHMAGLAGQSAKLSNQASGIAWQTRDSAARIAGGAQGLSDAALRMRGQAEASSAGAQTAVAEADNAATEVRALLEASTQIGSVVGLIGEITRQTSLLSINARIEAARAGEAGRGFAVVASEVMELAARTRRATDSIEQQISQVGTAAQRSAEVLNRLGQRISELGGSSAQICETAQEHCNSTQDISDRIQQVDRATQSVADSIQAAKQTAGEAERRSSELLGAAEQMEAQARQMQEQVAAFVRDIQGRQDVDVSAPAPAPVTQYISAGSTSPRAAA